MALSLLELARCPVAFAYSLKKELQLSQEKLLVVVDPNDVEQVALHRTLVTAGLRAVPPLVKVFVGVDPEAVDTRANNDNLVRDRQWFENEIFNKLSDAGLESEIEVSWSSEWQNSILESAKRFSADEVLLPIHPKTNRLRFTFSENKWELLKSVSCPVLLVRPGAQEKRQVILAAVNFQAIGSEQQLLNQRILERGHKTAALYGAELHIVNAYVDTSHYPDRGALANTSGLPAERLHVKNGYTDEVVASIAAEIDADLVIIGTLNQHGRQSSRRGNTAARVIGHQNVDVMVVN
jgi:universal stress protein E